METISRMLGKLLNREEPRKEVEVKETKPMGWLDKMEHNKEHQEETLKSRKAVSPVIATVILVAITITVAVAVAYWMSSIAGQYTQFEKVEIQSGYASIVAAEDPIDVPEDTTTTPTTPAYTIPAVPAGWKITIKLKNTGSAPSTITDCFINEKPMDEYPTDVITWQYLDVIDATTQVIEPMTDAGVTLESGLSVTIYINIEQAGVTFTSGTTINVKLHSAGGMDYIRLIQLS